MGGLPKFGINVVETGRGKSGSIFVCELGDHQIILQAKKIAPYKYDVYSIYPRGKYKAQFYAKNRRELRRKIEEWIQFEVKNYSRTRRE